MYSFAFIAAHFGVYSLHVMGNKKKAQSISQKYASACSDLSSAGIFWDGTATGSSALHMEKKTWQQVSDWKKCSSSKHAG